MTQIPLTSADYYRKATAFWNYPEIPYGAALREMIMPSDVVADIGCGIGIVSRFMAGFCHKVIAIDRDETPLDALREDIRRLGLQNIEVNHARWPDVHTEDWDVAVAFYHHRFGTTSEQIDALVRKTRRCGIIINQASRPREGFYEALGAHFGIRDHSEPCFGSCYVRGRLEQAGFRVTCDEVFHDFGQPVDTKDEAVSYAIRQLKLPEDQRPHLEEIILDYVEIVNHQMVLPIKRYNCMLRFYK